MIVAGRNRNDICYSRDLFRRENYEIIFIQTRGAPKSDRAIVLYRGREIVACCDTLYIVYVDVLYRARFHSGKPAGAQLSAVVEAPPPNRAVEL